jgi:phosphohistidine phosphatase
MSDRNVRLEFYLLRHADAGDPAIWAGDDAERPLSAKGVRQAERMGRHLTALGFAPDAIVTSPKIRAAQTAAIVGEALGRRVLEDDRLAGAWDIDDLAGILHEARDPQRVVLVGHDPDFSDVLAALVGAVALPLRKGALARVDVMPPIEPGGGVLRWLLSPDAIPG